MDYKYFNCAWLFILLLSAAEVSAFSVSEDVSGGKDYAPIQRYPLSKIEFYSEPTVVRDHFIGLGSLKKSNAAFVPEYSTRLSGTLTRVTYRGPDGHSSRELYEHIKTQVKPYLRELLFECEGRSCGSSNHWANRMFNIASLYGPERYQYYQVAKLDIEGKDIIAIFYAIRRGNKRIYLHMDILEVEKNALSSLEVNPATIYQQLRKNGHYLLSAIEFNDQNQLTEKATASLDQIVRMLEKQVRLNVYVVSHMSGKNDLDTLQKTSLKRAEAVVNVLTKEGVNLQRIQAQGVGPLAPLDKSLKVQERVELVVNEGS